MQFSVTISRKPCLLSGQKEEVVSCSELRVLHGDMIVEAIITAFSLRHHFQQMLKEKKAQ